MSRDIPAVTVVTITYKDLEGLRRTRESLESQSIFNEIQHVVVDGNSGDDVVRYLRSLRGDLSWSSEPDNGRYDAMNKGIDRAGGEYVWFMNSGDCFGSADAVETALKYLRGPGSWGYGYARFRDDRGQYLGIFGHLPFRLDRFALGGQAIPHQAALFGTDVIREVGYYDLDHGTAADQLFMLKCAQYSRPISIPEMLADFDTGGVGSTRPLWHYYRDMIQARRKAGVVVLGSHLTAHLASVALFVGAAIRGKVEKLVRGHTGHHA